MKTQGISLAQMTGGFNTHQNIPLFLSVRNRKGVEVYRQALECEGQSTSRWGFSLGDIKGELVLTGFDPFFSEDEGKGDKREFKLSDITWRASMISVNKNRGEELKLPEVLLLDPQLEYRFTVGGKK